MPVDVDALKSQLAQASTVRATGRVTEVTGLRLRFAMPGARIGDVVRVTRRGEPLACEVVGFEGGHAIAMPLGPLTGVGPHDDGESTGGPFVVVASSQLLGRVVDGLGRAFDGGPAIEGRAVPVDRDPPRALERRAVAKPMTTGLRVIDGLLTLGEGQRIGLFAGSGVGKSTLLGAIARGADADVVVVALVGERGREVGEFLERSLAAEPFRDEGARVLLLVDSITRFARAQREVGLAAGEPPVRRGYPPSVFAALPRLLERSGQSARGSITAIYTVLVEGGDMD